jgi:hypothetical protein
VLDALPRNLIAGTRAGSQVTGVGSETPLSLEPLHGGQRDGRTENGDTEIRGYEADMFSSLLSSIHGISFYT